MKKNATPILAMLFSLVLAVGCAPTDTPSTLPDPSGSCPQETPQRGDWVINRIASDPDMLTPFNNRSATAGTISGYVLLSMLTIDRYSEAILPLLATSLPEVSEDGMRHTFEIREEATWDDGSPVTGADYAFTLKVIKNPMVNCPHYRVYFEFVENVIIDPENPRKFTVVVNETYFRMESNLGFLNVLPRNFYDPEDLMGEFTIPQLNQDGAQLKSNEKIIEFAQRYNSERFAREEVKGCGAYDFESWVTGQSVTLKRKQDWWGDHLAPEAPVLNLESYPDKLIFKIIMDQNTALIALKNEELDALDRIRPKDFEEIRDDSLVKSKYELSTPNMLAYTFIGFNSKPIQDRPPFFVDKRVRRAMAHLVDCDAIIKNVYYGHGTRIAGPVPSMRPEAHDGLALIDFDPEKAKSLLDEAGWIDSNGNGIRDKVINGKLTEFEFEINFNTSNDERKNVALFFQKECEKVGVTVKLMELDFTIYLTNHSRHDFDAFVGDLHSHPLAWDPKQVWHTQSWLDGSTNYWGFGTPRSDSLIMALRVELDPAKQIPLARELQEMIYDEQPVVFIQSPTNRIAIHKRFRNTRTSVIRPGYWPDQFWTCPETRKYSEIKPK